MNWSFYKSHMGHACITDNGRVIASCEKGADFNLIASAPELLEELGKLLHCVEVYGMKFMHGIPCEEYVKSARAVIDKATAHRSA